MGKDSCCSVLTPRSTKHNAHVSNEFANSQFAILNWKYKIANTINTQCMLQWICKYTVCQAELKIHIMIRVDSIAVSLSTNSETAAATPLYQYQTARSKYPFWYWGEGLLMIRVEEAITKGSNPGFQYKLGKQYKQFANTNFVNMLLHSAMGRVRKGL